MLFFGVSLFPGYRNSCRILSNYSQGGSKSFRKDAERLARNEAFCGQGLGRDGVCKRQVTLYLQFYVSES